MSTVIGDLFVRLGVDATALDKGLGGAEKRVESFGTKMFFMGSRITAGVTLPIVGAAAAVAKFGMDFDKAMTEALAIMDHVTPEIRSQMEGVAIDVAKTTKFSAAEAAEAYYSLASAGLDAATAMGALPITAKFAQAGVMDLAKATDYLASAQAALGNDSESSSQKVADMAKIADVLTAANNRALGTVQDFAEALTNKSGAIMRQFNIPLEEGVAVLAAYASQGTKSRQAGQQFMMMVRDLTTQMIKHEAAFKKYSIAVFDANGNMRNMADIIADIEKATHGMNVEQQTAMLLQLGIPLRSVAATRALIGYSQAIRDNQKALEEAGGTTERVANNQMKAFSNQMALMEHQVEILGIRLFNSIVPVLEHDIVPAIKAVIAVADDMVSFFEGLPEPLKLAALGFTALVAAIGPLVTIVGSMSLLTGAAIEGITAVAGAAGSMAVTLGLAAGGSTVAAVKQAALNKAWLDASNAAYQAAEASGATAVEVVAASNAAGDAVLAEQALGGAFIATTGEVGAFGAAMALLSNPITIAVGLLAAAAGAVYYFSTRLSDDEKAIQDHSNAFVEQNNKVEDALKTYDELAFNLNNSKEQSNRLEDATRTLAEASGLSEDAFNREAQKSDELTTALRDQMKSRKDLAQAYGEQLQKTLNDERNTLNKLKAERDKAESGSGTVNEPTQVAGMVSTRTMTMDERLAASKRLTAEIEKQRIVAERAKKALEDFYPKFGPTDPGEAVPHSKGPGGEPSSHPEAEIGKLEGMAKKVQDLYDQLKGTGESELAVIINLWKQHGAELQNNSGAMQELAQRYLALRKNAHVSSDELDKLFAVQIEGFQKTHHEISQYEDIIGSAGRSIVENFGDVETAFSRMTTKAQTDAFWKTNAKGMEDLLPFFDEMPPKVQKMLRSYLEWKVTSKEVTDAARKDAAEAMKTITESADKIAADLEDKQDALSLFSGSSAEGQIKGLNRTMNRMRENYKAQIDKMIGLAAGLTGAEQDEAWRRIKIAQAEADKIIEVARRENLDRLLEAEGFSKKWIRLHSDMSEAEITDILKARVAWNEYKKEVQDMIDMFGSLGDLMDALGKTQAGKVIKDISSASGQFLKGVDMVKYGDNLSEQINGMIQMGTAAVKVWNELGTISSKAGRVGAGAMAGMQMGAAFGPWGAAIGAAVGAIAGLIKKEARWKQVQDEWKNKLGIAISDGTAQAIEATAKQGHSFDAAQLLNLDKIIADAGGVNGGNFDKFVGKMHDMFSLMERGEMTADEVRSQFSKDFPQIAQYVVDMGKVADPVFLDLMDTMKRFGIQTKETTDFVLSQAKRMGSGLAQAIDASSDKFSAVISAKSDVKTAQKTIDDKVARGERPTADDQNALNDATRRYNDELKRVVGNTADAKVEMERLGRLTMYAFNAAIAGGATFSQAMDAAGPSLDALIKEMDALGITTDNVALKALMFQRDFANNNKVLVDGLSGLGDAFLAASNMGLLRDPAVFKDFTDQLGSQFETLKAKVLAAGGTERDALQFIAPMLNDIVAASEKYGIKLDENTQKLVDQANGYGLLSEKQLTTNQVLAVGFAALLTALGKDIPKALQDLLPVAENTGDGIEKKFNENGDGIIDHWNEKWKEFSGDISQIPEQYRNEWMKNGPDFTKIAQDGAKAFENNFDPKFDPIDIHYRWKADNEAPDIEHSAPPTAVGGITTRPQVRLVGEAGPEAIIPLNKLSDIMPQPVVETTGNGGSTVIMQIDKREIGRAIIDVLPGELRRLGVRTNI